MVLSVPGLLGSSALWSMVVNGGLAFVVMGLSSGIVPASPGVNESLAPLESDCPEVNRSGHHAFCLLKWSSCYLA
ncbi:hypothetical protein U1Q18_038931 [Sarracenia purpurea var. burkii]